MKRRGRTKGFSIIEVLVVLSMVATVAALAMPDIEKTKRDAYVLQCKGQLSEIGVALISYRDEHSGRMPVHLGDLVPKYLRADKLICPFTRHVAPETVKAWQKHWEDAKDKILPAYKGAAIWSSYRYFAPFFIDASHRANPDSMSFTHAELLQRRGSDTPMAYCRDHREPWSLDAFLYLKGLPNPPPRPAITRVYPYPLWCFPEDPIVVLRWDGRVNTTEKGGSQLRSTNLGTSAELLEY